MAGVHGARRVRDAPEGDIPRADVAAVIAAVLDNDGTIGRQWELIRQRRVGDLVGDLLHGLAGSAETGATG